MQSPFTYSKNATSNVQRSRINPRTSTSMELANYLQRARLDSMRRRPVDVTQMAQVKMFKRNFYSVPLDADGDNQLDIPLVMSLPEEQALHPGIQRQSVRQLPASRINLVVSYKRANAQFQEMDDYVNGTVR